MRIFLLTVLSMLAFAANSLLCRVALQSGSIDPASFASIRIISGACLLALVVWLRRRPGPAPTEDLLPQTALPKDGGWIPALWLFAYATAFSFAYVQLPAGVGALLLFGAVQATMIGAGLWRGERFLLHQWTGFLLAVGGLTALLFPGLAAPPLGSAALMLAAGVAWGAYSLHGRKAVDAMAATTGNFVRAAPFALALLMVYSAQRSVSPAGLLYAVCSGAIASGLGYIIWYTVLPKLRSSAAATVQLSVPILAALGGTLLLGEEWSQRLTWTGLAILGGIALVVVIPHRAAPGKIR